MPTQRELDKSGHEGTHVGADVTGQAAPGQSASALKGALRHFPACRDSWSCETGQSILNRPTSSRPAVNSLSLFWDTSSCGVAITSCFWGRLDPLTRAAHRSVGVELLHMSRENFRM